jgi:hypothetical protein
MDNFAHTPFVVISAIKKGIVSGPFLIGGIVHDVLDQCYIGDSRSQNFYQLKVVSAENKIWKVRKGSSTCPITVESA